AVTALRPMSAACVPALSLPALCPASRPAPTPLPLPYTTLFRSFTPSARGQRIRQSPSTAAAARVRELKAEGRSIHDLTVGEPDFDTPDHIKAAAFRAIEAGETKYTAVNGTPQLREAIRRRLGRTTGRTFSDAEITVGGGGKQVICLAFMASLDPGDEVIIPAPYWVSYPDMVRANDGEPVIVETSRADRHTLTAVQLAGALRA